MAIGLLGAMRLRSAWSDGNPSIHRATRWREFVATALLMPLGIGMLDWTLGGCVFAQSPAAAPSNDSFVDPATGIVYRKVHRTIERPVVQTELRPQESTVYRPETVVEVTPETRTVYTPVVSYAWEPRVRGRWNPFVQPTLQYEHVPRTHWEARSETVERRQAKTNWVAERRRVDVPQQVVKIQREEKVDYEAIGRVAPQTSSPPNSAEAAIAARLRPIDASTPVTRFAPASSTNYAVVATQTLPPYTASTRSSEQIGIRATDLSPGAYGGYSTPLPPANVATNPLQTLWR